VIPYVPVSVSFDKSTSESVDPSLSISSSRSADPGLVRVYDIPRSCLPCHVWGSPSLPFI